jgi:hypothetical protein
MRKKSIRLVSAALAACMMLSVLPVGAFAAEPGTEPENGNGVSAQAEETLPFAGKEITEGGTYTMEGGEYTGPITVNVQDGKDVIINITGHVTTNIRDMLIKVVKGHVTINGGNDAIVENMSEPVFYYGLGAALIGLSSTDDNTTVEINGGTYRKKVEAAVGCENDSKGTLTINSGTFETGMGGAVENAAADSAAVMQIEEGTFIGGQACKNNRGTHALANYGTTIINGGVFQGYDGSAVYQHMGELQIHGGTFESMNPENTVIDIEDGPSKTTITGGYFSNVQSSRWGNVVNYESYMQGAEANELHITGGTFEIEGENVDGIRVSSCGSITIENATIRVKATSGRGAGIERLVDSETALKVKDVTIENAGSSRVFSDILLNNYRPGPVDFEITEDFTHKAVVNATQIEKGLQVTTETATSYHQKDLKLVSADPNYIIDYQKNDGGTEYRYFNTREMGKYYVNPINATMTADGEEKRPYSQFAQGDKVTLTANIPEGKQFVDWKVEKIAAEGVEDVSKEVKIDYEDPENPETAILTVPDYDIFVTAEYKEGVIIDPGTSDTDYGGDIAAGVVIGGIAAVGAYEVGTGLYRITQMDDVAMPTNRLALAKLLWERAGKPEPEGTALYSDISAEDTNAQKAARWAVEQELLNDDDSVEGELKFHPAFPVSKLRVCLTWEKAKQKGLFDQNTEA